MKKLLTNPTSGQTLLIVPTPPRSKVTHPDHFPRVPGSITEVGIDPGASGFYFAFIDVFLVNGDEFIYTDGVPRDIAGQEIFLAPLYNWVIPGTNILAYGEGWNFYARRFFVVKVPASQWDDWLAAH